MTREVSYRFLLASVTMTFVATLVAGMVLMRMAVPATATATATAVRFGHEGPELALEAALAAGRPFCYAGRMQY